MVVLRWGGGGVSTEREKGKMYCVNRPRELNFQNKREKKEQGGEELLSAQEFKNCLWNNL